MPPSGFPREFRLRRQPDFQRVHEANIFAADDVLVIRAISNDLQIIRVGISISRQVGIAVVRNRWKRLIREAFRLMRAELPVGLDLVVRPRRGGVAELRNIQESLRRLVPKLARRVLKGRS